MSLRGWGWVNGVSDGAESRPRRLREGRRRDRDDELRTEFLAARDTFQAQIDQMADEHRREEDEDW